MSVWFLRIYGKWAGLMWNFLGDKCTTSPRTHQANNWNMLSSSKTQLLMELFSFRGWTGLWSVPKITFYEYVCFVNSFGLWVDMLPCDFPLWLLCVCGRKRSLISCFSLESIFYNLFPILFDIENWVFLFAWVLFFIFLNFKFWDIHKP